MTWSTFPLWQRIYIPSARNCVSPHVFLMSERSLLADRNRTCSALSSQQISRHRACFRRQMFSLATFFFQVVAFSCHLFLMGQFLLRSAMYASINNENHSVSLTRMRRTFRLCISEHGKQELFKHAVQMHAFCLKRQFFLIQELNGVLGSVTSLQTSRPKRILFVTNWNAKKIEPAI